MAITRRLWQIIVILATSNPVEAAVIIEAAPSSGGGVGSSREALGAREAFLLWCLMLMVRAPVLLEECAKCLWKLQRRCQGAGGMDSTSSLKGNRRQKTMEGRASQVLGSEHPVNLSERLLWIKYMSFSIVI